MTPGERHARLLFAPFQSSPQSFPKNELELRSSYPTPRRKCPDVDQLEFRFMPDLSPNAEGSVHSTNTMTAKNVLPAHSHSVTRPRPGWHGLYSKLWDKWPYLSCSFSFVTRRYSLNCSKVSLNLGSKNAKLRVEQGRKIGCLGECEHTPNRESSG